jgi:hypothetical protein
MSATGVLETAKAACQRLAEEAFPEERKVFSDIWDAMFPLFEKWRGMKPRARRFVGEDLSAVAGLGMGEGWNWGFPIALSTVVATMLELWEVEPPFEESNVVATAKRYAIRFGASPKLRDLLVERIPGFCQEVLEEMGTDEGIGFGKERRQKIEAAMPERHPAARYIVLTHESRGEPKPLTRKQVSGFKKKKGPRDFFLWIDESEGKVFVKEKPLRLGPRLRKVLRCLVEIRGELVKHSDLVDAAGWKGLYSVEHERTSGRWANKLRTVGKGQLKNLIRTEPGGFVYDGPESFCIIKHRSES